MTRNEIIKRVREVVAMVSMEHAAIPLRVSVAESMGFDRPADDHLTLLVRGRAPDRDTGEDSSIIRVNMLHLELFEQEAEIDRLDEFVLREVYEMLRHQYLHELDEAFKVNGVRVFDPHATGLVPRQNALAEAARKTSP